MIHVTKTRKALLDGALIGDIHHDRVPLPQLMLDLESLPWEWPAIVTSALPSLVRHTVTKPIPRLPRITTICQPSRLSSFSFGMGQDSIDHGHATAGWEDLHTPCIPLREA
jgi:hypothetical protein